MRYINPVYKRELKQAARTKKTLILLLAYNMLLAGFGLIVFYLTFDTAGHIENNIEYSGVLTLYSIMAALEFIMVLLIVPASTSGAVVGEREKQTLDLLLSTKISTRQVVTGKLAASISTMILIAISSLPVLSIVYSIGGITLVDMAWFLILIVVTAVYIGSFGILFSVCCRRQTVATVCSYVVMLFLTLGLPIVLYFMRLMRALQGDGLDSIAELSACFYGERSVWMLLDPVITFVAMTRKQVGKGITLMDSLGSAGEGMYFLAEHWFVISILCQLAMAVIVIGVAAWLLNPVSGRKPVRAR